MFDYENIRDRPFFSGGILSNVLIHEQDMSKFIKKNEKMFSNLTNEHLKLISN